jgi:hypothetical protein
MAGERLHSVPSAAGRRRELLEESERHLDPARVAAIEMLDVLRHIELWRRMRTAREEFDDAL